MQRTLPAATLSYTLTDIREGNRYALTVTGASTAVALQFQPVAGGAWFPVPGFSATAVGGVVYADFVAVVSLVRVNIASASATDWTVTWVKQTTDTF